MALEEERLARKHAENSAEAARAAGQEQVSGSKGCLGAVWSQNALKHPEHTPKRLNPHHNAAKYSKHTSHGQRNPPLPYSLSIVVRIVEISTAASLLRRLHAALVTRMC